MCYNNLRPAYHANATAINTPTLTEYLAVLTLFMGSWHLPTKYPLSEHNASQQPPPATSLKPM